MMALHDSLLIQNDMKKYKTTQKAVKETHTYVICLPYCAIHTLLSYENPSSYTVNKEGWAADIYRIGCAAIVTGVSPFGKIRPECDVYQRYEEIAQRIKYDLNVSTKRQKIQFRELLEKFVLEVTGK